MNNKENPIGIFWDDIVSQLRRIITEFPDEPHLTVLVSSNEISRVKQISGFSEWVVAEAKRITDKYPVGDKFGELLALIPNLCAIVMDGDLAKFDAAVENNYPFADQAHLSGRSFGFLRVSED